MKKLYKSNTDRVICGAAGGIAEYFGINSTLLRIIWAFICLIWGAGLILYIVAAILMPRRDENIYASYEYVYENGDQDQSQNQNQNQSRY